jgi:hypothetical protein
MLPVYLTISTVRRRLVGRAELKPRILYTWTLDQNGQFHVSASLSPVTWHPVSAGGETARFEHGRDVKNPSSAQSETTTCLPL